MVPFSSTTYVSVTSPPFYKTRKQPFHLPFPFVCFSYTFISFCFLLFVCLFIYREIQHHDPVWDLKWIERGAERGESLVSASTDGRVLMWDIKKGLEVRSELMRLRRVPVSYKTAKQTKAKEKRKRKKDKKEKEEKRRKKKKKLKRRKLTSFSPLSVSFLYCREETLRVNQRMRPHHSLHATREHLASISTLPTTQICMFTLFTFFFSLYLFHL